MEQEIEHIRRELEFAEHLTDYEAREDDPEGWSLTEGYVLGLERALAMLAGSAPWLDDEIYVWASARK